MQLQRVFRAGAMAIGSALALMTAQASAQVATDPPTAPLRSAPPSSQNGQALPLALDEAVRRAIDHNPDLAIVRLAVDADAARAAGARGLFEPVLSTTLGRSESTIAPSNFLLGTGGISTNEWFSSAGVRQRLQWGGGIWNVSWDAARTSTSNSLSSFDPSLQSGLQLAFSQPLFRDRKIDPARHQYAVARRNQEISDLRFRESVVQTVAAVKTAYWTLKATRANVTVQQRSLELAEDLVRQNRARVSVGQSPPLDLVQAEAEVAQRRENLIRAGAAAGDAEDRLRRLIMDPADVSFWRTRLDPVEQPAPAGPPPDVDQIVAEALKNRYDLTRERRELDNADAELVLRTNQTLPDVRLEASYRQNGAGGSQLLRTGPFPGVVTGQLDRSFGDTFGQVFSNDYPTWSVGVTVSHPFGRSFEKASVTRAEVERRQTAQRIASLQLQVAETIRQAARQMQSAAERVEAARSGETLAEQRFEVETKRFEAGLSTSFLVTEAQRDLLQAQVSLLQATLDHQASLVNFEAVQLASPAGTAETFTVRGSDVVALPTPTPSGIFRQGSGF